MLDTLSHLFGPFWWFFVLLVLIYGWAVYRNYLYHKRYPPLNPQERGEYFHLLRQADWGFRLTDEEYSRLADLEKRFHAGAEQDEA